MRAQGSGTIVNNSSLGGLVGLPERGAYHASKHGVIGLTQSAALEYAPHGIRINAICPGTIETPMVAAMLANGELDRDEAIANQPIARLGTAEEMNTSVRAHQAFAAPKRPQSPETEEAHHRESAPTRRHLRRAPGRPA